tara:strand:+ start:411 stop:953 length:543 start_codon:yes stop_codon:yes gene_type:complete
MFFLESNVQISKKLSDKYCLDRLSTLKTILEAHGISIDIPSATVSKEDLDRDTRIELDCSKKEVEEYFMRLTMKDADNVAYFSEEDVEQLVYSNFKGFYPTRPVRKILIDRKGIKTAIRRFIHHCYKTVNDGSVPLSIWIQLYMDNFEFVNDPDSIDKKTPKDWNKDFGSSKNASREFNI